MDKNLNGFISSLPLIDQIFLMKKAEKIQLKSGDLLSLPTAISRKIFFPISGSIALYIGVSGATDPSQGLAIGLVGVEGVAGLQLGLGFGYLPIQLLVQSPGEAYVVSAGIVQKLIQLRPQVLLKVSKYLWSICQGASELAALAYKKDIKIRLAHWLLMSADRCAPDQLRLTHLQLAKMLGVRRSSLSIAAKELKLKRYINYSRGQINLTNIKALKIFSKS